MMEDTAAVEIMISFTATRPRPSAFFMSNCGDHAFQRGGEHGAHLALLVGGEDVNDTVDGFAGVVRVQRAEHEEA